MNSVGLSFDLEEWARRTIAEALISEIEFCENLPRIGRLGVTYGFESLGELFINMTTAGLAFAQVLILLERGDVPLAMRVESSE